MKATDEESFNDDLNVSQQGLGVDHSSKASNFTDNPA
jgi:hypothetical protein